MLDMHIRPSELLGIDDTYLAFCFDEACAYIIKELNDKKKPIIRQDSNEENKSYKKPSDLYNKYN